MTMLLLLIGYIIKDNDHCKKNHSLLVIFTWIDPNTVGIRPTPEFSGDFGHNPPILNHLKASLPKVPLDFVNNRSVWSLEIVFRRKEVKFFFKSA